MTLIEKRTNNTNYSPTSNKRNNFKITFKKIHDNIFIFTIKIKLKLK